jgi:Tol biopolymer transport system component
VRDLDTGSLKNITHTPGYDAEATVAADGRIVFTSVRSGDIELWMQDGPDSTPRQITHEPGYDGGAFFSHDGRKLVWRASRPADDHEFSDYRALLAQGLVRPTRLELYVANSDGSDARQITNNGKANFAPFFTPDDKAIVFASNMDDPRAGLQI